MLCGPGLIYSVTLEILSCCWLKSLVVAGVLDSLVVGLYCGNVDPFAAVGSFNFAGLTPVIEDVLIMLYDNIDGEGEGLATARRRGQPPRAAEPVKFPF